MADFRCRHCFKILARPDVPRRMTLMCPHCGGSVTVDPAPNDQISGSAPIVRSSWVILASVGVFSLLTLAISVAVLLVESTHETNKAREVPARVPAASQAVRHQETDAWAVELRERGMLADIVRIEKKGLVGDYLRLKQRGVLTDDWFERLRERGWTVSEFLEIRKRDRDALFEAVERVKSGPPPKDDYELLRRLDEEYHRDR